MLPAKGVNIFTFPNFREYSALVWFNPVIVGADVCDPSKYGFDCGPDGASGLERQYYFISQQQNADLLLEMAEDADSDLLDGTSSFWNPLLASILRTPGHQWKLTEEGWDELAVVRNAGVADGCGIFMFFTHAFTFKSSCGT